jgi:dTDP-4-amino-4,6-dideoxygalactose transaminase
MRDLPFGANYLNIDQMPELISAIENKTLFRFLTPGPSAADLLENLAAKTLGAKHALALRCGTEALRLALLATCPRVGEKVYIPCVTFVAVAGAVLSCGLIPVLTNVDDRLNLDVTDLPSDAERVIVAHMDGFVGPVPRTPRFAIEDCCQCFGARHSTGANAGSIGYAGVFSFNHQKILSSGEGGLLVTSDLARFSLMRRYHDHGAYREHGEYPRWEAGAFYGENFVTSETVAAVQLQQLRCLGEIQAGLERGYQQLTSALSVLAQDRSFVIESRLVGDAKNTVRLIFETVSQRDLFCCSLAAANLAYWTLDRYYLPSHPVFRDRQSIYADGFPWNLYPERTDLDRFEPVRSKLARIVCLPVPPELSGTEQGAFGEKYADVLRDL